MRERADSLDSVHDGDVLALLTALDILTTPHLPTAYRLDDRDWRTSQIVPIGGSVIFELLSCVATAGLIPEREQRAGLSVRININDGIVALPGCDNRPRSSCPLESFLEYGRSRSDEVGRFWEVCGLGEEAAERITILHQ